MWKNAFCHIWPIRLSLIATLHMFSQTSQSSGQWEKKGAGGHALTGASWLDSATPLSMLVCTNSFTLFLVTALSLGSTSLRFLSLSPSFTTCWSLGLGLRGAGGGLVGVKFSFFDSFLSLASVKSSLRRAWVCQKACVAENESHTKDYTLFYCPILPQSWRSVQMHVLSVDFFFWGHWHVQVLTALLRWGRTMHMFFQDE